MSMFTPVTQMVVPRHLTTIVYGPTKSRRTGFAVATCDEPIFYFARRGENVEEGLLHYRDRDIKVFNFGGTMPLEASFIETRDWARPELQRFKRAHDEAVTVLKKHGGTIVIDKGKDLRDLYLLAHFGNYRPDDINAELMALHEQDKSNPKPNRHLAAAWGPVQAAWNKLIYSARSHGCYDMIVCELEQDEYKGNNTTGRKIVKAGSELDVQTQVMVKTDIELEIRADGKKTTRYMRTIVVPEVFKTQLGQVEMMEYETVKKMVIERYEKGMLQ